MEDKNRTGGHIGFALLCTALILMGLFLRYAVVGYSFSSMVCFGLLALAVCYKILSVLAGKYKNTAKALRLALDILVGLGMTVVSLTRAVILRQSMGSAEMPCKHIVVLGAGVHGTVPSLSLRNRLDAAGNYLKENPDVICIVSGGQGPGEEMTEAACMQAYLVERGVAPERILLEEKSASTWENFALATASVT